MKTTNLNIYIRNLKKHKIISFINLFGLTIGLLSSLFILEYVFFERSYDTYHTNGQNVYRLAYNRYQNEKLQWETANSFFPSGKWLNDNYSEVINWAVISRKYNITVSTENELGEQLFFNEEKSYYAGSSLFQLFTIPIIQGEINGLDQPNTVAIAERSAKKYFGNTNPVGKTLKINSKEEYTVTAVFETIPFNSHLQSDFFFSIPTLVDQRQNLPTNWGYDYFHTYLQLAPNVDYEEFCRRALPQMIAKNYSQKLEASNSRDEFYLQPLPNIHLYSNIEYETEAPGNPSAVKILLGFALFLIIIAWINYINLITAQSLDRAREIGIKKVNGAKKHKLIWQFISEAFVFNLICLILTLTLFLIINPAFKAVANIHDFNFFQQKGLITYGLLIFFFGVLASSVYPALLLTAFKPISVLKGKFKNSTQGLLFRRTLITVQFVISIALLIGTLVTFKQASFLMKKDMGIDFNSSLVIRAPHIADNQETLTNKLRYFKEQAQQVPGIEAITISSDVPGQEINNWFSGRRKGYPRGDNKAYFQLAVDNEFINFYKIKLLAGRTFRSDETFDQRTIMMNISAMERFGFSKPEEAINQIFERGSDQEWQIIGIVNDFQYKSVKTKPVPTIITLNEGPKTFLTAKLNNTSTATYPNVISSLKKIYTAIFPNQPFEYFSQDEKMRLDLKPDKTFSVVFTLFSALAIFIAISGIIGLVMITINQNRKELGMRKVLGAEIMDVSTLLSKQILIQFIIALLISIPLSYYGYRFWFLDTYVHHINLNIWFFIGPVLLIAGLIFTVISLLTYKAYQMNLSSVLQND